MYSRDEMQNLNDEAQLDGMSDEEYNELYGEHDDACDTYQEHCDFTYSTDSEWDRAEACEIGYHDQNRAWICTDRDVWHKNPYYVGPPVRHPEDDPEDDDTFTPLPPFDNSVDYVPF